MIRLSAIFKTNSIVLNASFYECTYIFFIRCILCKMRLLKLFFKSKHFLLLLGNTIFEKILKNKTFLNIETYIFTKYVKGHDCSR